jgi:hypothetical protein
MNTQSLNLLITLVGVTPFPALMFLGLGILRINSQKYVSGLFLFLLAFVSAILFGVIMYNAGPS